MHFGSNIEREPAKVRVYYHSKFNFVMVDITF